MIYQSQFSDYNDQLYSVELETPPTGSETQWVQVLADGGIKQGNQCGWLSWGDNDEYVGQTDYRFTQWGFQMWHNSYISRSLPDGQYWFNVSGGYFNGIDIGDVLEFRFKFKGFQTQDRSNGQLKAYGIKFGHIIATNSEGVTTYSLDSSIDCTAFGTDVENHSNGTEYSFTFQSMGSSVPNTIAKWDYFGFIIRNTNCNCFKVSDLVIYNKTKGTSFTIIGGSTQWSLQNYYDGLIASSMGELHMDIAETTTNQAQQTVTTARHNNQSNGLFESGYYFEAWTNSESGNFYTFDQCAYQVNDSYRFPNWYMYKKIDLVPATYKFYINNTQTQGLGTYLYLLRNGEVVERRQFTNYGFETTIFTITTTQLVDEIRIGNTEQTTYFRENYITDVWLERLEIKQTRVDVTLGGEPFTVELQGDDEDLFKPIRTSIATATIVSEDYLFNLYSNQNDINVRLIKGDYDGDIEWMGIVKPLVFDMGYNQELEEIQIECADYIGSLENIYLTDLDIITNHPIMSFGELFNKILFENTKYKNLYVPNLTNFDMLSTYRISTRNFIDDDCKIVTQNNQTTLLYADKNWSLYKILEEMCKYMGVTLVVEGEDVILIPYLQLQFTYTFKKYSIGSSLTLIGSSYTKSHSKSVVNLYDNSDLSLLPVLNKFSVKTKTNKVKEIIPDFLDDDNVENITNVPVGQQTTWETSIALGNYEFDDKTYQCDVKMLKTKSDKCTNYIHVQSPKPTTVDYDPSIIHTYHNYPVRYTGLVDGYCGGIIDFRAIEQKEDSSSNLKSNAMTSYERYLVLAKGSDDNINLLPIWLPCFKIVSDEMQFTNKMALQISGSLIQTPYVKASNGVDVENVFDQVPIERDEDMHIEFESGTPGQTNAYKQTNMFCNLVCDIKIGDYYFHNAGVHYDSNGIITDYDHFFRKGWWETSGSGGGLQGTRLQFDNESSEWAFGKSMSETDNSGDSGINQDNSGYWIMFNANEQQMDGSSVHDINHVNLPEKFTGRLEILFYPNGKQSINDDGRYFGSDIQFLKDFKVKLVVPRNMEYTEDEWNSETQIDAVIDSESLRKAQTIEVEMHTDFGKCPAYSVVMGAQDYQVINMNEGSHCAEEWIVYNYTNQYSDVRKVLDTSVNGEIHPYSLITMTGRNHFGKMVVDSYKKDYRTGYTKVKLIEICNLQEQI